MAMPIFRPAPILLRARPIMLFGVGSYTYPNSRNSVGQFLVDLLARRLGIPFHHSKQCSSYLAHYEDEDLLLVKPDTFLVQDNKEALRRLVLRWPNIDPAKSIFLYHDTTLPIGEVRYIEAGRTDHNLALHHLAEDLQTDEFPRIAIGIEHPIPNVRFMPTPLHYMGAADCGTDELYLLNKFTPDHWLRLHELTIPKTFSALDSAIGRIRTKWPLSTELADKLYPGTYGEDEGPIPPPPQLSRKQQRQQQRRDYKNKQVIQPISKKIREFGERNIVY